MKQVLAKPVWEWPACNPHEPTIVKATICPYGCGGTYLPNVLEHVARAHEADPAHIAKPRILELGSGAGGMTRCLLEVGFHVVGIDTVNRPERPRAVEFIQADWHNLEPGVLGHFDAAIGYPPCPGFSTARPDKVNRPNAADFENVYRVNRHLVEASGPWCIWALENVAGSVNHLSRFFGKPFLKTRGHYFWGHVPELGLMDRSNMPGKGWNRKTKNGLYKPPSGDAHLRAMIKPEIGMPLARALMEAAREVQAKRLDPATRQALGFPALPTFANQGGEKRGS